MADEAFNLCEYIWNDDQAMQRLLSILRQSQNYCTDNECFSLDRIPGPLSDVPSSTNFLMTCLIIAFMVFMYVLRPDSLRQTKNNNVKERDNERDSNNGPPAPPAAS